ncbi:MAG: hypothetical protein IT460_05960 [Planctomycetes bacterium]|nr:hypothetical protein [Planctomycetota bacterium]
MTTRGWTTAAVLAAIAAGIALWTRPWERPDAGSLDAEGAAPDAPGAVGIDGGPGSLAGRGGVAVNKDPAATPLRRPVPVAPGPRLLGRVVDPAGAGVAGARVLALPDTVTEPVASSDVGRAGKPGAENFTDAEGRFVVAAVGDAPLFSVVAEAAGFAPSAATAVRPEVETTVALRPASRLVGRVTTMDLEPVADATVRAETVVDAVHYVLEARSGPDGAYVVTGLPPASGPSVVPSDWNAAVSVTKEGFAPLFVSGLGRPVPGKPDDRTLDLVLVRGATLVGRVVDATGGARVAGATVLLWSVEGMTYTSRPSGVSLKPAWAPRPLAETTSDAEGSFRFDHVPANGFHRIGSHNSGQRGLILGWVGAWKDGWTFSSAEVPAVADGVGIDAEVRLRPSGTVAGRVVDEAGKPVADVTVSAQPKPRDPGGGGWAPSFLEGRAPRSFVKTDADGRFRISGAPGAADGLAVTVSGWPPATWTVAGLPGGQLPGFQPPNADVEVRAGAETAVPDLVLRAPKGTGEPPPRVVLVITDVAGAPVAGATASANRSGWGDPRGGARSDRAGRLPMAVPQGRRGGVPPTPVVKAAGFAPTAVELPANPKPDEEVRVTLRPGRSVAGRVRRADGSPAAQVSVTVSNGTVALATLLPKPGVPTFGPPAAVPGGPALVQYGWANTADDGTFTVTGLPDGPYHVVVQTALFRPGGAAPPPATLSDVPSDATGLELTLAPDPRPAVGKIRGSVVDAATGRTIAAVEVTATRRREESDPPPGPSVVRSDDGTSVYFNQPGPATERVAPGRFEVTPAQPGRHDLTVTARGYAPTRVEGVLVGPDDVELAPVALGRGARVHGRIRWPGSEGPRDRVVTWSRTEGGTGGGAAELALDGTYEVTGLLPGSYRVTAAATGWGDPQPPPALRDGDEVVVVPEGTSDLAMDLVLVTGAILRVMVMDARLPPAPWEGPGTDAQRTFGRGATLTLLDGAGRVVRKADTLEAGVPMELGWTVVPPGPYVARLALPGGEVVERRADVAPGATTELVLAPAPGAGPK